MERYEKKLLGELLNHKEDLYNYVNMLYGNEKNEAKYNYLFSELKREGYVNYIYADNRVNEVILTAKAEFIEPSVLRLSDKEELLEAIGQIEQIKGKFHHAGSVQFGTWKEINDIPEFQDWLQCIIAMLQEIQDRKYNQYIIDTINICKSHWNGTRDEKLFMELSGRLKYIEKNIDKYYVDEIKMTSIVTKQDIEYGANSRKRPLVFVSHSSKDKSYVELIVKLLKDMGLKKENIFCSSVPGYGIRLNKDIVETIRDLFTENELYVIFVHSPNYYDSKISLNEMGAAWALKTQFCSILLPKFEYSSMTGVVNANRIAVKIDDERRQVQQLLNELYEDLSEVFSIPKDTSVVWESARDEFIDRMNSMIQNTDVSLDSIEFSIKNKLSADAEKILMAANNDESGTVIIDRSLEGISVQVGNMNLNTPGVRREEARMEAAIKELMMKGYLNETGKGIYKMTNYAYQYID